MAKELPYFKFYIGEWLNGDITIEDYECQGVFINVCAYYWQKDAELTLTVLMKRFRNYETQIKQLIESKLIKVIGENISISFLNEQMESKEIQKITNQKNGAKGGRPRKEETENKPNGFLLETETKAKLNPNITNIEERKEEENIEEEIKEKKSKPTKRTIEQFQEIARKSFENCKCVFGNDFKKEWFTLIQSENWKKKDQNAYDYNLKRLMKFDEIFSISLVEASIAGSYKGVVFPNTNESYQKYLKEKNATKSRNHADLRTERSELRNAALQIIRNG